MKSCHASFKQHECIQQRKMEEGQQGIKHVELKTWHCSSSPCTNARLPGRVATRLIMLQAHWRNNCFKRKRWKTHFNTKFQPFIVRELGKSAWNTENRQSLYYCVHWCMLRKTYQVLVQMATVKSVRNGGTGKTPWSHVLSSLATSIVDS